jgi:excisionase family DNA binding protein
MANLWTYQDLADYLQVGLRTAKRRVKEDGVPFVRIGRSVRFDPAAVQAWVERRQTVKP